MKKDQTHIRARGVQPGARGARVAGFTVLELMIAVAVLGILVGIGVPSFNSIIRQNRLATQTNDLIAATAMARSEAVKRGTTVTLCPVDPSAPVDSPACSDDNAWGNGWMVFSDEAGAVATVGTFDPTDTLIQRWPASAPQRMTVTNDAITTLTYRGDGGTTLGVGVTTTFVVAPEGTYCENPQGARSVTVTATGRVSSAKVNCP